VPPRNTGRFDYLVGLVKTNVVRGTAIPIQLAVLFALVEWQAIPYLIANAVAIGFSGLYRYVLDARWTWGEWPQAGIPRRSLPGSPAAENPSIPESGSEGRELRSVAVRQTRVRSSLTG